MAKNDSQYGGRNSYILQGCNYTTMRYINRHCLSISGTITTLISPADYTPCNLACCSGIVTVYSPSGSTLQCDTWLWDDMPLNSPKRPPYWISTSGFDFDHITAVDTSFCTSLRNFIQIGPPSAKMTSCRFSRWRISAILDSTYAIMDSLKSPIT